MRRLFIYCITYEIGLQIKRNFFKIIAPWPERVDQEERDVRIDVIRVAKASPSRHFKFTHPGSTLPSLTLNTDSPCSADDPSSLNPSPPSTQAALGVRGHLIRRLVAVRSFSRRRRCHHSLRGRIDCAPRSEQVSLACLISPLKSCQSKFFQVFYMADLGMRESRRSP